jgi:hypothetical protein
MSPEMTPMAKPRAMAPNVGRVMGGFSVAVPGVVRQRMLLRKRLLRGLGRFAAIYWMGEQDFLH